MRAGAAPRRPVRSHPCDTRPPSYMKTVPGPLGRAPVDWGPPGPLPTPARSFRARCPACMCGDLKKDSNKTRQDCPPRPMRLSGQSCKSPYRQRPRAHVCPLAGYCTPMRRSKYATLFSYLGRVCLRPHVAPAMKFAAISITHMRGCLHPSARTGALRGGGGCLAFQPVRAFLQTMRPVLRAERRTRGRPCPRVGGVPRPDGNEAVPHHRTGHEWAGQPGRNGAWGAAASMF